MSDNQFISVQTVSIEYLESLSARDIIISNLWANFVLKEHLEQRLSKRPEFGPFKEEPFTHTYDRVTESKCEVIWNRVDRRGFDYHPTVEEATMLSSHIHMWTFKSLNNLLYSLGVEMEVLGDYLGLQGRGVRLKSKEGERAADFLLRGLLVVGPPLLEPLKIIEGDVDRVVNILILVSKMRVGGYNEPILYVD